MGEAFLYHKGRPIVGDVIKHKAYFMPDVWWEKIVEMRRKVPRRNVLK